VTEAAARPTVLVLDDEKNIRKSIELTLEQEGFQVLTAPDVSSALRTLHERIVEVLIIDIQLGEIDGITFFRKTQADGFAIPAIFISGHATLTQAALAVKSGGFDFIEKPFSAEKIVVTVRRCLEMAAIKERLRLADVNAGPTDLVGESRAIKQIVAAAAKVAKTHASVLITGESGTGKELVAGSIHAQSDRSEGPIVKVNCSAIPDSLLESELFGYEKGAFTGAVANKKGLFESAHRGTIFLDEVADLSLPAQAKILRVLQNGEIQKVGAQQTVKVDVRVLSGTHKDLKQAVAEGAFREDLFYRLNVIDVAIPPLRQRPEDILPLATHLLHFFSRQSGKLAADFTEEARQALLKHPWPGNVRELRNAVERGVILTSDREVGLSDLPAQIGAAAPQSTLEIGSAVTLEQLEAEHIRRMLAQTPTMEEAATVLGIDPSTLYRKRKRYGL
jgi:DNA-binding NtrC family response regulator